MTRSDSWKRNERHENPLPIAGVSVEERVRRRGEAVVDEKKDNWEAKERSLEERVENQERLVKELRANCEVSQRLGAADGSEADNSRGSASVGRAGNGFMGSRAHQPSSRRCRSAK